MQQSTEEYDYIYKLILIGNSGVGKSNILTRYVYNKYEDTNKSTIGVEFGAKSIKLNNLLIKAQIWDTAGQEKYQSITNAYYKGSKGAFIVFDIANRSTYDSIEVWIERLFKVCDENLIIVLVGNKIDIKNERKVSEKEAKEKALKFSIL